MTSNRIIEQVKRAATKRLLFLPHPVRPMARPERMITSKEVREVIEYGKLLEDYPEGARGYGSVLQGRRNGRREIHVVRSPKEDHLAVITAYLPSEPEWESDLRTRKTR